MSKQFSLLPTAVGLLSRCSPIPPEWMDGPLRARSAEAMSLLWGRSTGEAEAKVHVIALPSSPPEQFNEWWQSQTTVKMVTSARVTSRIQIKSAVKVQSRHDSNQMWLLSGGWCPEALGQPLNRKDGWGGNGEHSDEWSTLFYKSVFVCV